MPRARVWFALLFGWLPVGGMFVLLLMSAHGIPLPQSVLIACRLMGIAALLGLGVYRFTAWAPWPHPFRQRFVAVHALAALVFSVIWVGFNAAIEGLLRGRFSLNIGPGLGPYLVTGIWIYLMVAGISYAIRLAERAAQVELQAAQSQLAALRMQLQPHFLFNALHTVVQLIPLDPRGAVRATELLAGLLRTSIEEQRDLVPLETEWTFVQRYLALEGLRFGERLVVRSEIEPAALRARLPSFALQTLVENAVRHAAAPAIDPTTVEIRARLDGQGQLILSVSDDGPGADAAAMEHSVGTGLRRLRERLAALFGSGASLVFSASTPRGLRVELSLPQLPEDEDSD